MSDSNLKRLKYPIGEFQTPKSINKEDVKNWIRIISEFPNEIRNLTQNLTIEELNFIYRPDGWSVKQVTHHCADSHMNALIRFKLCLTEEKPIIRPYQEALWANLSDSLEDDITNTLLLIQTLHHRWVLILNNLNEDDLSKEMVHPQYGVTYKLYEVIANYAWHCEHHLAHIKNALHFKGKYN
jgi:hypothetical protein